MTSKITLGSAPHLHFLLLIIIINLRGAINSRALVRATSTRSMAPALHFFLININNNTKHTPRHSGSRWSNTNANEAHSRASARVNVATMTFGRAHWERLSRKRNAIYHMKWLMEIRSNGFEYSGSKWVWKLFSLFSCNVQTWSERIRNLAGPNSILRADTAKMQSRICSNSTLHQSPVSMLIIIMCAEPIGDQMNENKPKRLRWPRLFGDGKLSVVHVYDANYCSHSGALCIVTAVCGS